MEATVCAKLTGRERDRERGRDWVRVGSRSLREGGDRGAARSWVSGRHESSASRHLIRSHEPVALPARPGEPGAGLRTGRGPRRPKDVAHRVARAKRIDPRRSRLRPTELSKMPAAVVEHVRKRVSNLPRRPELFDVIAVREDGAPSALKHLVERLAHPNRKPLHPPRKRAPVRRLDDHVEVPALHRPVEHPHPKAPLRPRNRPHDHPIEPSTPKPKPSIDPKRHMHRHIVRKRRPRIMAHARAGPRPTRALAPPPVPQPVEMKLRLPPASPTSLGRASGALSRCGHTS